MGCRRRYEGPAASLVVKNAKIVTVDKENPRAEAVAVSGERDYRRDVKSRLSRNILKKARPKSSMRGEGSLFLGLMMRISISSGISVAYIDLHGVTDLKEIQQRGERAR